MSVHVCVYDMPNDAWACMLGCARYTKWCMDVHVWVYDIPNVLDYNVLFFFKKKSGPCTLQSAAPYLHTKSGKHAFPKNNNYFEPESVAVSDWNRQWYSGKLISDIFWATEGTTPKRNDHIGLIILSAYIRIYSKEEDYETEKQNACWHGVPNEKQWWQFPF